MGDLKDFEQSVVLNEKQQKYLEAFEWLRSEEPRGEGRTTLQAYIIIRDALRNPGTKVRFGVDHSADYNRVRSTYVLLPARVKDLLTNSDIGREDRFAVTQDTLEIFPWICGHCRSPESEHVDAGDGTRPQCLFGSTRFVRGFVGSRYGNDWVPRSSNTLVKEKYR
jgi:hypothetical protein